MTNPYAMNGYPEAYPQVYPQAYPQNYPQSKSNGPSVLGMATLGAIGGGSVGYFKNRFPVGKDGSVSDTFAKEVFEKNLKKNASKETKAYFTQLKTVLDKIDKIKSPEEFKKLLTSNKKIIEDQCKGISAETLLDAVNSTNLKSSKESLKKSLEAIMNFEILKTQNAIKLGWNSEKKKFIKTSEFKDGKLFDIIKGTKNNIQWKKALKYGGITAGVMGALTLGYKMLTPKT